MNKRNNTNKKIKIKKTEKENSSEKENRIILYSIIIAILIVSVLLITSLMVAQEEHFSSIGILDENKTTNNYPREVQNGTPFYLWAHVNNYEGNLNLYLINITLGDENTTINRDKPSGNSAILLRKYICIVEDQHSKLIFINLTVNTPKNNSRLIFELWIYDSILKDFKYMGLWAQLWINITKSG